ncbi:SDR family NAD(P)-dependent oxidoreductase [Pseudonocardia sp. GCM10023141]|uniref:SDR family NAD(P)-dependent oxidoreductase n=1 Tax=Pseudonocardia sp. GCM10023141 TaxID=3252653 RepID=UPI0036079F48
MEAAGEPVRLDGRVIVVTGAGAGLGASYARGLAERGAAVVVNDIGRDAGGWTADQLAARIREDGGRAVADRHTGATPDGAAAIVDAAMDAFGGLDGVVANAGIVRRGGIDELSVADVRDVLTVNLEGALWLTRAAFPVLRERGSGRIVLVTSSAGIYGHGLGANYCASKGGVAGLLRALAVEGAPHGIRTNAVSPFASTPMTSTTPGRVAVDAARLDPAYVAPVVVYLASAACSVNGQVLTAAGGTVAHTFSVTTQGWRVPPGGAVTAEGVRDNLDRILDPVGAVRPVDVQSEKRHLLDGPVPVPTERTTS